MATAKWHLEAGPYLGEISALAFLRLRAKPLPLLLAGTGSQILSYDLATGACLGSFHAFQGVRVHGISILLGDPAEGGALIAVFGEKRINLVRVRAGCGEDPAAVAMEVECRLPRFNHWVLDALFLKEDGLLVVGLGDNSVAAWDIAGGRIVLRLHSPGRCLLYSMRLWGSNTHNLLVASGTIYNEIIIWKLVSQDTLRTGGGCIQNSSDTDGVLLLNQQYYACNLERLSGHEGSIFRMTWSLDGSKLISASDDRSARVWKIPRHVHVAGEASRILLDCTAYRTLYGHDARIWDCYVSDSIYITVGEDCTCRIWDEQGDQLRKIREHNGRGIWRCLFDTHTSLIITAGFDSGIKVHQLYGSSHNISGDDSLGDVNDKEEIFSFSAPKASEQLGLLNSKSEYVRCLQFANKDALYVATNNAFLYHLQFSTHGDGEWTQIARVSDEGPIICLDLITLSSLNDCTNREDMIAIGDGKGNATVVRVTKALTEAVPFSWVAEAERQLLGVHWCESLGCSHLFTADPRGGLKLWNIVDILHFIGGGKEAEPRASLVAIFQSIFNKRILCVDALHIDKLVLLGCGDQRGNISIFLFPSAYLSSSNSNERRITPITQFKSAHGISSVASVALAIPNPNEVQMQTTGGDGCICYFKFCLISNTLEFMGMRQVKGLSIVSSIIRASNPSGDSSNCIYADGFSSTDFIVWNLVDELKVNQVTCGGWRRPYSRYFGDHPEIQNCFAFVKDHMIHVHRIWMPVMGRKICSKVMHMQFHGREMHTLCFISFGLHVEQLPTKGLWLATGCEDGTVRLTRYMKSMDAGWSCSQLLGEHVGGSAVRSLCFISKIYKYNDSNGGSENRNSGEPSDDQLLLISVGAKQVLTSWLLYYKPEDNREALGDIMSAEATASTKAPCLSFQWLSTHIPPKVPNAPSRIMRSVSPSKSANVTSCIGDKKGDQTSLVSVPKHENDWRYMAVTAFIIKTSDSRITVCFIVVAGSDATVVLRALLLPHRLWFDVATLVSHQSPFLTLKHVAFPSDVDCPIGNTFIIIGGSTCGSVYFWDVTHTIQSFLESLQNISLENFDWQKRPRTGRGSQGGRWWKLSSSSSQTKDSEHFPTSNSLDKRLETQNHCSTNGNTSVGPEPMMYDQASYMDANNRDLSADDMYDVQIKPLLVLNSVHQSGVNCLHVTETHKYAHLMSGPAYGLVSGGDDQSLQFLFFDLEQQKTLANPKDNTSTYMKYPSEDADPRGNFSASMLDNHCKIRILNCSKVLSAHNAAVKGVWTDGMWVFSTGLDQRIRCWIIDDHGELVEYDHLIVCVPEPESLDAIVCDRNHYQIAVAGRGMQMVDFFTDSPDE